MRTLLLLDSIGYLDERAADAVVVAGSHGGQSAAGYVLRHPLRPHAVFFNDAGVGKDRAGIVGLDLLDGIDVICATYGHHSARIGDADDGWRSGVITHVNAAARAAGLAPGQSVAEAVARLRETAAPSA